MFKQDLYDWSLQYGSFPRIPVAKQWMKEPPNTPEQLIIHRLMLRQPISSREENLVADALHFYKRIITRLKKADFEALVKDLNTFKPYFWYAFNNYPLVQGELYVPHLVRVVKNKSVLKRRDRIVHERFLTCPTRELVKEINQYNRANTPDFNIFYGSSSIDAVLNEVRPDPGDLVTTGIWTKKNPDPLQVYPVHHHQGAIKVNADVQNGYKKFVQMSSSTHVLLRQFMDVIFGFISDEFAKPVHHHSEYLLSALFSEWILTGFSDPSWVYHAIAYPSVQNRFCVHNLAIKPEVIRKDYKLSKVIEFEVAETFYEKQTLGSTIEAITLSKYRDQYITTTIDDDGNIRWQGKY